MTKPQKRDAAKRTMRRLQQRRGVPVSTHGVKGSRVDRDSTTGLFKKKHGKSGNTIEKDTRTCALCDKCLSLRARSTKQPFTSYMTLLKELPKRGVTTACKSCVRSLKATNERDKRNFAKVKHSVSLAVHELDTEAFVLVHTHPHTHKHNDPQHTHTHTHTHIHSPTHTHTQTYINT
jgi:hypothetical protein